MAVLDFTDVFAPSMVFDRESGLLCAKQTVPRSEVHAGNEAGRIALGKTTLVLISDNEYYFVSTAQRGRTNPVEQCSDLWLQHWAAVEYHSAAQPFWMFAGNEFADRLAVKGAEAPQHSEWTVKRVRESGV